MLLEVTHTIPWCSKPRCLFSIFVYSYVSLHFVLCQLMSDFMNESICKCLFTFFPNIHLMCFLPALHSHPESLSVSHQLINLPRQALLLSLPLCVYLCSHCWRWSLCLTWNCKCRRHSTSSIIWLETSDDCRMLQMRLWLRHFFQQIRKLLFFYIKRPENTFFLSSFITIVPKAGKKQLKLKCDIKVHRSLKWGDHYYFSFWNLMKLNLHKLFYLVIWQVSYSVGISQKFECSQTINV